MATKAVTLAQKSRSDAEVLLPHTSADLVGYEKENSTATNVKEALDEMNDNFQGEKPGIVQRVEDLEEKVQPFTAPTASAAGTEGLVPGPHAITSSLQPLRVLSANAQFNTMTFGSFDISWERSDSTNLVLGAQNCANGTNLEDLLVAGDYYASQWTNAPAEGEGVYSLREMSSYGDPNPTVRVSHAFFYAISARKLFWRGGVVARPAGQKQEWREWIEILGDFAPMPTLSAGVGQMFVAGYGYHTLPAGGTWYVQTLGITIDQGITTGTAAFLAGGTQVGNPGTGWVLAQCLYA